MRNRNRTRQVIANGLERFLFTSGLLKLNLTQNKTGFKGSRRRAELSHWEKYFHVVRVIYDDTCHPPDPCVRDAPGWHLPRMGRVTNSSTSSPLTAFTDDALNRARRSGRSCIQ